MVSQPRATNREEIGMKKLALLLPAGLAVLIVALVCVCSPGTFVALVSMR